MVKYAREWILDIEDISDFVAKQREKAIADDYSGILTPTEHIYPVSDAETVANLGLTQKKNEQNLMMD